MTASNNIDLEDVEDTSSLGCGSGMANVSH